MFFPQSIEGGAFAIYIFDGIEQEQGITVGVGDIFDATGDCGPKGIGYVSNE